MGAGTINAYNLAEAGVNVDKAQIHKQDGQLTKAQNCTSDTTGVGGGVRKRPGLVEFNSVVAGGAELGGIGVPITLETASVGGVALGAVSHKIYWGRSAQSANVGASVGWWASTDSFATAATLIGTGSTPEAPRAVQISNFGTANLGVLTGGPNSAVTYKNKIYYASNDYTRNTDAPKVRVFDGVVDQEFARIPTNPAYAEAQCQGILSMLLVEDLIYLTVYDNDGINTAGSGRVFSLDPSTGVLALIGLTAFTDQYVPYCLAWYLGRLWVGTVFRQGTGSAGTVHFIRPGIDTNWTLDRTMSQGRGVANLSVFQGCLFAGSLGTATSVVEKRTPLGAWTVSLSVVANLTFQAGIEFKSNLYINSWQNSGAISLIRKFDGTSWSTAYTGATPLGMSWIMDGMIFFGGGGDNFLAGLVTSTDAVTWTDRAASLSSHSGLNSVGILAL